MVNRREVMELLALSPATAVGVFKDSSRRYSSLAYER